MAAGADGSAAAAAEGDDAIDSVLRMQLGENDWRALAHGSDASPRSCSGDECGEIDAGGCGDFLACDIGSELWRFESADIDEEGLVSAMADDLSDEGVFFAFGVHGSEDCDGGHDHCF